MVVVVVMEQLYGVDIHEADTDTAGAGVGCGTVWRIAGGVMGRLFY
jgi:hypothetical protein